ncbi:MAG: acylphosphatase [Bacteroidales bacterium]|jgi:acylphosphatase|nr:acylphosphatase [Bacteroidales bacterium]
MEKAYMIYVYGNVQGVGFRYSTLQKANELSLKEFVHNKPDGSVYIEAEGDMESLEKLIVWCRQGPPWSRVDNVNYKEIPLSNYKKFVIR